ncbi:hypothetical protein Btru_051007 [Bulinus truncatus]|nr:hypothetical protein Btru_051007 [Bulinus truncatus]
MSIIDHTILLMFIDQRNFKLVATTRPQKKVVNSRRRVSLKIIRLFFSRSPVFVAFCIKICNTMSSKTLLTVLCLAVCISLAVFQEICKNQHNDGECDVWAQHDECTKSSKFMSKYCAKSCGTGPCQKKPSGSDGPIKNQDSCDKADKFKDCGIWAQKGECNSNPEWMAQNCAKTCATGPCGANPPPVVVDCVGSNYGCCPDGITAAKGENNEGCDQQAPGCSGTTYGCCPDGVTAATGESNEGCDHQTPGCSGTTYGCCPDGVTAATGENNDGCEQTGNHDCSWADFGCCPDGISTATGENYEGCPDTK